MAKRRKRQQKQATIIQVDFAALSPQQRREQREAEAEKRRTVRSERLKAQAKAAYERNRLRETTHTGGHKETVDYLTRCAESEQRRQQITSEIAASMAGQRKPEPLTTYLVCNARAENIRFDHYKTDFWHILALYDAGKVGEACAIDEAFKIERASRSWWRDSELWPYGRSRFKRSKTRPFDIDLHHKFRPVELEGIGNVRADARTTQERAIEEGVEFALVALPSLASSAARVLKMAA